MSISELDLEVALVKNGIQNSYLIVNQTPRTCIFNTKLEQVGVFSTQVEDKENPRWKAKPDDWMTWQPEKASHPVYIERSIVAALQELTSKFTCQTIWHPETDFPNVASFCVYPLKHEQLLPSWRA